MMTTAGLLSAFLVVVLVLIALLTLGVLVFANVPEEDDDDIDLPDLIVPEVDTDNDGGDSTGY